MKRIFVIVLIGLALVMPAQPPRAFYATYGGAGDDIGYSCKPTLDGHYIVAGSTSSYGNGNTDVYLMKVDSMGNGLWDRYYGGIGNDAGKSVIQLPDSGFVIAGFTNSYGAGGYDAFLLRVDKNGTLIWQKTFGGLDWDFASDLVVGSDGNLFVVGNTSSFGSGNKDGFILKYDLLGNLISQKFFGGEKNDELSSIITTNDNFLATVGYTESKGEENGDGYFLKIDLNGDTLFTRTFGGPFKDYAKDLVQKNSSENYDYYLSGAKTFSLNGKTHAYMYRISSTGGFLSDANEFRNAEDEEFTSVANSNQQAGLTAFVRSTTVGVKKMQEEIFIGYMSGFYYLVNDAGGFGLEYVYSVEATRDKGYITVGSTDGFGSAGKDIFLVKRDSAVINYSSIVGTRELPVITTLSRIHYQEGAIFIAFPADDVKNVEIYSLYGQKLVELTTHEKNLSIDVSVFHQSMYILKFRHRNGQEYSRKIIAW